MIKTERKTQILSLAEIFVDIRDLTFKDIKDVNAAGWKLMEEVGEFGETVNHALGYLPHKTMKETPFGEAADVIQNIIAILFRLYPEMSTSEIMDELQYQMCHKNVKWRSVVQSHPEKAPSRVPE